MKVPRLWGIHGTGKKNSDLCPPWQGINLRFPLRALTPAPAAILFLLFFFLPDLWAFTITEKAIFSEGPYLFNMEVQVSGRGSAKKRPMEMTSLKVKIKNDRTSSKILEVKSIRVYPQPQIHQDLETNGYPITPAKWATKYFRLSKKKHIFLGEEAFIEVIFDTFTVKFKPWDRKFQGPIK